MTTTDTAPAYFGDAARAAWDEIAAGTERKHSGRKGCVSCGSYATVAGSGALRATASQSHGRGAY